MANAVKFTGAMSKANFAQETTIAMEGILQRVGNEVAKVMQSETKEHDYKGTLTKSITWRTLHNYGRIPNTAFLIDAPDVANAVDVGTHAPYAWYREYGAGEHRKKEGAAQFAASISAWLMTKLKLSPADEGYWKIVNSIRKGPKAMAGVQNKMPFLAPTMPKIPALFIKAAQDGLTKMWNALGKKYKI